MLKELVSYLFEQNAAANKERRLVRFFDMNASERVRVDPDGTVSVAPIDVDHSSVREGVDGFCRNLSSLGWGSSDKIHVSVQSDSQQNVDVPFVTAFAHPNVGRQQLNTMLNLRLTPEFIWLRKNRDVPEMLSQSEMCRLIKTSGFHESLKPFLPKIESLRWRSLSMEREAGAMAVKSSYGSEVEREVIGDNDDGAVLKDVIVRIRMIDDQACDVWDAIPCFWEIDHSCKEMCLTPYGNSLDDLAVTTMGWLTTYIDDNTPEYVVVERGRN